MYPAKEHCSHCGLCDTEFITYVKDACAFLGDGGPLVAASLSAPWVVDIRYYSISIILRIPQTNEAGRSLMPYLRSSKAPIVECSHTCLPEKTHCVSSMLELYAQICTWPTVLRVVSTTTTLRCRHVSGGSTGGGCAWPKKVGLLLVTSRYCMYKIDH